MVFKMQTRLSKSIKLYFHYILLFYWVYLNLASWPINVLKKTFTHIKLKITFYTT